MKRLLLLSLALTLLVVAFIFWNSCQNSEDSHAVSGLFTDLLRPILGVFARDEEQLGFLVRKLAHFAEFSALGICVSLSILSFRALRKKTVYGFGFFFVLAVAVLDETFQYFAQRGSLVLDVLLDFFGAAFGFAVVFLASWLIRRKKKKG